MPDRATRPAPQVIDHFYTGDLAAATFTELTSAMQLADFLIAPACAAACRARLGALPPDALSLGEALAGVQLEGVSTANFCARLLQRYGAAPSLLGDAEFGALPLACVLALLGGDDFCTDREDTVVLLLAQWVAPRRHALTDAELAQLSGVLRLGCVSAPFFDTVVPHLDWIAVPPAVRTVRSLGNSCIGYAEHLSKPFRDLLPPRAFAPRALKPEDAPPTVFSFRVPAANTAVEVGTLTQRGITVSVKFAQNRLHFDARFAGDLRLPAIFPCMSVLLRNTATGKQNMRWLYHSYVRDVAAVEAGVVTAVRVRTDSFVGVVELVTGQEMTLTIHIPHWHQENMM